ncbi:RagB/SusD family nutrient uptake outer membrane protein [Mucilaginibacter sp. UR6-11]|uniref:RagB/SusD family nutrient uptake outer membrane protein n=1 Tax=Mucilaginibacter sp. UR6-11 TaxID=1435644 RepID=UPI001E29684F|nr:RagB/SusD family nutrient uptake outer membrane protein [Mucilaginibacter sp. UR6-11]MCC8426878.1 RagB/SusD family nutrient uptake outer membrane protein [Mucilaginibacter sp. UR6-11]
MKHYKYIFILLALGGTALAGCNKFLDIKPKGKTLLTTVTDYDQWLNDPALDQGFGAPTCTFNYFADNVDAPTITTPPTLPAELIYTWMPQFTTDVSTPPLFWGEHYAKINEYNTVVNGIDAATGGTESQKRSLKAEALLGRALEYFYLVNEYGKPYDSTTVNRDLAVPFVTSNDVTQKVPPRSTIAEIYQHIIDDVNSAIPNLPLDNSTNRFRGSTASAYSMLARIYFYARNYTEARKNAELALANSKAVMIDFNGTLPTSDLITVMPDVIYGRYVLGNITPTLDFMRSFDSNDLRVKKLYFSNDGYKFITRGATVFIPTRITPVLDNVNTGTSVQEMKLIIAECAARSNDLSVALQQLDEVRKNRYATASYVRYQSTVREDVLKEVLRERSHELPFCGLRWFDMRRLDKENRMGTVNRYDAQGNIIATLPPHSNRYTLQIPVQVLSFNPGMQQNP